MLFDFRLYFMVLMFIGYPKLYIFKPLHTEPLPDSLAPFCQQLPRPRPAWPWAAGRAVLAAPLVAPPPLLAAEFQAQPAAVPLRAYPRLLRPHPAAIAGTALPCQTCNSSPSSRTGLMEA